MRLNCTPAPCNNGCRISATSFTFQSDEYNCVGLIGQRRTRRVCVKANVPPVAAVFCSRAWNVPKSLCVHVGENRRRTRG